MENLPVNNGNGQSYGYTLYEAAIGSGGGTLDAMNHVRDRALVRRTGVGVSHVVNNNRAHRRAALPPQSHRTNGSFSSSAHFHFFLLPCQVFVDRQFVGVLDYETQELSVPEGKVTLTVIVSISIYLYLYCMSVCLSVFPSGQSPEINIFSFLFTVICKNTRFWLPAKHVDLIVHMFGRRCQSAEKQKIQKTLLK